MTVTGTHLSQPRPEAAAVKARQEDAMVEHAGAQLRFLPPYSPDLNPIESAAAPLGRMTVSGPIAKLAGIARGLTAVRRRRPQEQNRGVGIGSQVRRWLSSLVEMARWSGRLFRPEFAPCRLRNACGNTMGRK